MKITVKDVRAIKSAETDDAQVIQIMGNTMAGKSSLLNAVGAALIGKSDIYGATKANLKTVVREGEGSATALVEFEGGGELGISWPGDAYAHHPVPKGDEITAGFVDPCADYDAKKWAQFVRSITPKKAKLTIAELESRLFELPGAVPHLVTDIIAGAKKSWDSEAARCQERALGAKRVWRNITGENFGAAKAQSWQAPGYVEKIDREKMESDIDDLDKKIRMIAAHEEMGKVTVEDCQGSIASLRQIIDVQKHTVETNKKLIDLAVRKLEKLDDDGNRKPCPHCQKTVIIVGGELCVPDPKRKYDPKQVAELKQEIATLRDASDFAQKTIDSARAEISAKKQLMRQMDDSPKLKVEGSLETLRETLDRMKAQLAAREKTDNAMLRYIEVLFFDGAKQLLEPNGLRLEATKKSLPSLQALVDFIKPYLFPDRELTFDIVDSGIEVRLDGMPYKQLTWNGDPNSYRLRIKYLCQFLQSQSLGRAPVVLDRLDTLQRDQIANVLKYLKKTGTEAIVGRTAMQGKPDVDLLKKAGLGLTYWINDGVVEPI